MQKATNVARGAEIETLTASIDAGQSVLLAGPAGVGKSHLAALVATSLEADGWQVVRLSGGPAMQTVHLGAAQPLLSLSMARTPDELFANAEDDLRRRAGAASTLVVVDDINQVDPATAALLRQLASAGIALLATVRDEGAADPFVLSMWTEGLLERIDLAPLTAAESSELIDLLLAGTAASTVHEAVFGLAAGNPLFTRELIADARQSGVLVDQDAVWRLEGPLRAEQRVADLFVTRLAGLADEQLEALELIALAEPLPLPVAGLVTSERILEQLQSDDLVDVVDGQVRCDHPMLSEVARRETPSLRVERHVQQLVEAILSSTASSPSDVLRAVRWQLQRGEVPAPDVAAAAAQTALSIFDGATAVQCAHAAFHPESAMAHVLLGRSQLVAQDIGTAVATLRRGYELASTDEERALTAVGLSESLMFGTGDFVGASDVLEQSLDAITAAPHRAMVAGSLSLTRALVGDFTPALDYGDELLDSPEIDDMARLHLSLMWTVAAASVGRSEDTQRRLDTARDLAYDLRETMPAALDQILTAQFLYDSADGRLDEALDFLAEHRALSVHEHRYTPLWDHCLAIGNLLAGQTVHAVEHINRTMASVATRDPLGVSQLGLAVKAMIHATAGDVAAAMAAHDASIADPRCGPREQGFLARARSNVLALQSDIDAAVAEAHAGATNSVGGLVWGGWSLYDAVRFDRAPDVAVDLGAIARQAPFETVLAMNDHCEALTARDAARLSKAAERLARAGLTLFAAEAAAHAARQLGIDGDATGSALLALRSFAFFDKCRGARSLAVEALERPLTDREHEVARAAAASKSSQEIADELFVSRRTVDNHLQNAYRKLGINQRDELTRTFSV